MVRARCYPPPRGPAPAKPMELKQRPTYISERRASVSASDSYSTNTVTPPFLPPGGPPTPLSISVPYLLITRLVVTFSCQWPKHARVSDTWTGSDPRSARRGPGPQQPPPPKKASQQISAQRLASSSTQALAPPPRPLRPFPNAFKRCLPAFSLDVPLEIDKLNQAHTAVVLSVSFRCHTRPRSITRICRQTPAQTRCALDFFRSRAPRNTLPSSPAVPSMAYQ